MVQPSYSNSSKFPIGKLTSPPKSSLSSCLSSWLSVCQSLKSVYQVCQFIKFASQFFANMLFSIVLLIILAYAIKHWEVSVKMSVNDWKLELFRQRQRQTKTDKDKDRNRQIQRQTKSKTKTKAKTGQKQTSNARTKTNIQLQKPTPKLSSHYTDGFYSTFGDIITLP